MRRFSQRNSLVTLNEINITPLLDLAFVLLIVFIISTPMLEQGLDLHLPTGGKPDHPLNRNDIRIVDIGPHGRYFFDGRLMALQKIEATLVQAHRADPNLVVRIRSDQRSNFKYFAALLDRCERHGITRISVRTQPEKPR